MRTNAEEIERIAEQLLRVARRIKETEEGARLFTREDVDRIVEARLARERKKRSDTSREG